MLRNNMYLTITLFQSIPLISRVFGLYRKSMEKEIEDPSEKNEANKMFIIWFPVRGTGNKC